MFDIGFWELVLISVIALVFIGPERLPNAIRTVSQYFRTAKTMANNIKNELSQELQLDEMQSEFHKVKDNLNMKPQELSKYIDTTLQSTEKKQSPDPDSKYDFIRHS